MLPQAESKETSAHRVKVVRYRNMLASEMAISAWFRNPAGQVAGVCFAICPLARPMSSPPFGGCQDPLSLDTGRKAVDSAALGACTKGNQKMAMKQYWCRVLNQEGRVKAREILEGSNDNEPFGGAQRYLIQDSSIRTVEVWLEDRYVGKIHSR